MYFFIAKILIFWANFLSLSQVKTLSATIRKRMITTQNEVDTELTLLKRRNQWMKEQISFIQFLPQMEVKFGPRDSGFGLKSVLMQH